MDPAMLMIAALLAASAVAMLLGVRAQARRDRATAGQFNGNTDTDPAG
ncbi:hypothetical protein BSLA_02r2123 [Burkholderia stabilis]|nr:hypothetical protein BSLA_02r2123 [Burkholderia stabilis]